MREPRLDRDRQQWIFGYLVKETGRVFHWDADGRNLPASVKSHAQISKHVGRIVSDHCRATHIGVSSRTFGASL